MHGSAPVKVELRWPALPRRIAVSLLLVMVALSFVSFAFTIVGVVAFVVWAVAGLRIDTRGGGFRPLRYSELLELAALGEIEVWEHNEAVARARQS